MKFYIIVLSLLINTFYTANSLDSLDYSSHKYNMQNLASTLLYCDACGCAAGNGSSGFESLLNPQYIGVKYFAQHYQAKENLFSKSLSQDQYFNTLQLWGKIPITKRSSLYASLPFHFHEKRSEVSSTKVQGLGDANIMGIYELTQPNTSNHQLNAGIGLKIPLGKFDEKGTSGVNPSFQLGTGSWDYQFALSYKYQKNLLAVLLNTDYTLKTVNKKQYKFGNQWNYALTGFHRIWRNDTSIISGKLGLQGEVYDWNQQYQEIIPRTSGSALYGKIGFETSYQRWSLGTELMLPVYSNLASQDIKAKSRLSLFINFGL